MFDLYHEISLGGSHICKQVKLLRKQLSNT
jgi:hypothetical protein